MISRVESDLRVALIAGIYGVSVQTVWRWIHDGRFPHAYQTPGGQWRIPQQDVDALRAGLGGR